MTEKTYDRFIGILRIAAVVLIIVAIIAANIPPKHALAPASIKVCDAVRDHECTVYIITFVSPDKRHHAGEGYTDYDAHTITITRSRFAFENIVALNHEVMHAALWGNGYSREIEWQETNHDLIYKLEDIMVRVYHDNPEFLRYVQKGY